MTPSEMSTEALLVRVREIAELLCTEDPDFDIEDVTALQVMADRLAAQAKRETALTQRLRDLYDGLAKVARDTGVLDGIASLEHERAGRWVDDEAYGRLADVAQDRSDYEALKRRQCEVIDALLIEATGGEGGGQ